jgi:hypothetical protein
LSASSMAVIFPCRSTATSPGCADLLIGEPSVVVNGSPMCWNGIISSKSRWAFLLKPSRGFGNCCVSPTPGWPPQNRPPWRRPHNRRSMNVPGLKPKKNRASQSGGDRKARGIFELSTTVGLRRTSTQVCTGTRDEIVF